MLPAEEMTQKPTGDTMEKSNKQEERIAEILGADSLAVTLKSLTLYRDYLRKNLDTPCTMTGVEGLPWKEIPVFDYDDKTEYEAVKSKQPSYTDIYELKRFEDLIDEVHGIMVKVKRVIDNQRFILDLASLKGVDKASKNYMLLDDYFSWFANHQNKDT
jgi:hypothetical protein